LIHSFSEPGNYRGSVYAGKRQTVFYVSVDPESPVAQVNIDLAALARSGVGDECGCKPAQDHFSVNPKGYAVFHVSSGAGGYHVQLRRAVENRDERVFNSLTLCDGDIFSATIIRPGRYTVINTYTRAQADLVVSYPVIGKSAYRPPAPVRISCTKDGFEPGYIELKPAQGLIFECQTESRVLVRLVEPDDGPKRPGEDVRLS
jgi:hypothetical protein